MRKTRIGGALGVLVGTGCLLTGCGTGTAQATVPIPTWQTVQLAQGSVMVQIRVPVAWTKNLGLTGAGDSVVMGPHNWSHGLPELGLRYGVSPWNYPKPVQILSYKRTYSIFRELKPDLASVWVAVPNTASYRKLAQTIMHSVKQIPLPQKKG